MRGNQEQGGATRLRGRRCREEGTSEEKQGRECGTVASTGWVNGARAMLITPFSYPGRVHSSEDWCED